MIIKRRDPGADWCLRIFLLAMAGMYVHDEYNYINTFFFA